MSDFKKLTAYKPCGVEYVSVSGTSYVDRLKAENAKPRELVRELMPTARIAAQHGINVGKLADQERRARDLGVEVDG